MADPAPADWLAKAQQARDVAENMHDPSARRTMLAIAAGYEKLPRHAALAGLGEQATADK